MFLSAPAFRVEPTRSRHSALRWARHRRFADGPRWQMLRSLQIADQIARTGHMPVRRLDLIWISARNAARRELDLGVAALVEAVTLLTADVEGSTRLSQTRLNELAADYPTLDQNISEAVAAHGGVTRPVDQEVGSGLVVAFLRAGDAIACAGTAALNVGAYAAACRCAHRRCPAARRRHHHRLRDQRVRVCATSHTKARLCFQPPLAIWSSTSFRQIPG